MAVLLPRCVRLVDVSTLLPSLRRRAGLRAWRVWHSGQWHASWASLTARFPDKCPQFESLFAPSAEEGGRFSLERCVRLMPHEVDGSGFFVAVFEKLSEVAPEAGGVPPRAAELSKTERRAERRGTGGGEGEGGGKGEASAGEGAEGAGEAEEGGEDEEGGQGGQGGAKQAPVPTEDSTTPAVGQPAAAAAAAAAAEGASRGGSGGSGGSSGGGGSDGGGEAASATEAEAEAEAEVEAEAEAEALRSSAEAEGLRRQYAACAQHAAVLHAHGGATLEAAALAGLDSSYAPYFVPSESLLNKLCAFFGFGAEAEAEATVSTPALASAAAAAAAALPALLRAMLPCLGSPPPASAPTYASAPTPASAPTSALTSASASAASPRFPRARLVARSPMARQLLLLSGAAQRLLQHDSEGVLRVVLAGARRRPEHPGVAPAPPPVPPYPLTRPTPARRRAPLRAGGGQGLPRGLWLPLLPGWAAPPRAPTAPPARRVRGRGGGPPAAGGAAPLPRRARAARARPRCRAARHVPAGLGRALLRRR
jgi:hypothetical protein